VCALGFSDLFVRPTALTLGGLAVRAVCGTDKMFPVYGFGGQPGPQSPVSHCFALSPSIEVPGVQVMGLTRYHHLRVPFTICRHGWSWVATLCLDLKNGTLI
jgi:hypothetical protein